MHVPIHWLLIAQGLYYLVTAVWPLVHMRSFERVTGPKTDHWLVKTVGVLIGVIGVVLLTAAARGTAHAETVLLAAGSAAVLAGVDFVYVAERRISRVYLLDGFAEVVLVLLWAALWLVDK